MLTGLPRPIVAVIFGLYWVVFIFKLYSLVFKFYSQAFNLNFIVQFCTFIE